MLIVMVISIIFFIFIRVESPILRVVYRVALVPVIAGVSYEFIRLAGNTDNLIIRILSLPGMWLQSLTTKEPDDDMIEVAIAAVEAVFDWRAYQGRTEEEASIEILTELPDDEAAQSEEELPKEKELDPEEGVLEERESDLEEEFSAEKTSEQEQETIEKQEAEPEKDSKQKKELQELQDIEDILEAEH